MITRPVNILMSKKLRIVVACQSCPIDPSKFAGNNQKSACIHLRVEKQPDGKKTLKKIQQCDYYRKDSLKKLDYDVAVVDCEYI